MSRGRAVTKPEPSTVLPPPLPPTLRVDRAIAAEIGIDPKDVAKRDERWWIPHAIPHPKNNGSAGMARSYPRRSQGDPRLRQSLWPRCSMIRQWLMLGDGLVSSASSLSWRLCRNLKHSSSSPETAPAPVEEAQLPNRGRHIELPPRQSNQHHRQASENG